eukprot:TRINITY_DN18355_c0_g1_i1.p1 TRINITY_DN18355_c0_g1~~TRINITY_DN18355_c0_g1_i1.p1  ORF type:complete len:320 (+),score=56.64 TRINITY_DN18355_c0_g1_i1:38-961(+)
MSGGSPLRQPTLHAFFTSAAQAPAKREGGTGSATTKRRVPQPPGLTTVNCVTGCEHNCRYCYARHFAVTRFSQVAVEDWPFPKVRWSDVNKRRRPKADADGTGPAYFFPSSHDITPSVLEPCLTFARNLLEACATSTVMIVTKPHLTCVERLCDALRPYRGRVSFRLTLTSADDALLHYWEPGAPPFAERLSALRLAHERGYQTSVGIEPMLSVAEVPALVRQVAPYVTGSIYVGLMNRIDDRVAVVTAEDQRQVDAVHRGQAHEPLLRLYRELTTDTPVPVVWSSSFRRALRLDNLPDGDELEDIL